MKPVKLTKGSEVLVAEEFYRLVPTFVGQVGVITGESRNHAAWWVLFPSRSTSIDLHKDLLVAATPERINAIQTQSRAKRIVDLWLSNDGSDYCSCVSRKALTESIATALGETEWQFDMSAAPASDTITKQPLLIAVEWDDGRRSVGEAYYVAQNDEWWWANESDGDYHTEAVSRRPYAWRLLPEPPAGRAALKEGERP